MEVDSDPTLFCNKIKIETFTPLHINTSEDEGLICLVLWNEFMILLYESDQLNSSPFVYYHNKFIMNVQCIRNILLFIDSEHVLYFTILRKEEGIKNTIPNKILFKRLFDGIINIHVSDSEIAMLNKKEDGNFVNIFNIIGSSKFKLIKKFKFNGEILNFVESQMSVKPLNSFSMQFIEKILIDANTTELNTRIVFLSQKDSIYKQQLSDSNRVLSVIHICPAKIVHFDFYGEISSSLCLFLVTGSIVILTPDEKLNKIIVNTLHLNCSVHSVTLINQKILYTNTDKFWESKISIKDSTVEHRLLKITNVHDFSISKSAKLIYCVTSSNLIYSFHLESEEQFSSKTSILKEEYVPIPKSLKGTGKIFKSILNEMEKNKRVIDMINCENNLITTIALSRKSELSLSNLGAKIRVYNRLNDIEHPESDIILTEDLFKYYLKDTLVYLVEFDMSKDFLEKFKEFLKDNAQKWYLNVNLGNNLARKVISMKLTQSLNLKIAIPVYEKVTLPYEIRVKLISLIPDVMSSESYCWCFFPTDTITIDIKYHLNLEENNSKDKFISKDQENENNKIIKIAKNFSGSICNIRKERSILKRSINIPYYIRLPESYNEYASEFISCFVKFLNPKSAQSIKDRLNPKNNDTKFRLSIMNNTVEINLFTENNIKKIEIYGKDHDTVWQIYKYLFDTLSQFAENYSHRSIAHFDYMRLQRIKNDINTMISSCTIVDKNTITILSREFYCDIIGIIPL